MNWQRVIWCWLLLAACGGSGPATDSDGPDVLVGSKNGGDFRGSNMGDLPVEVMENEGSRAVYTMPDELVYRINSEKKDSTWYEISYNFNEQGLYNIDLEVVAKSRDLLSKVLDDFVIYYTSKYGPATNDQGVLLWRTMIESGSIVTVSIADGLQKMNQPAIRVNYNESRNKP
jgi:hypothetical protein